MVVVVRSMAMVVVLFRPMRLRMTLCLWPARRRRTMVRRWSVRVVAIVRRAVQRRRYWTETDARHQSRKYLEGLNGRPPTRKNQ